MKKVYYSIMTLLVIASCKPAEAPPTETATIDEATEKAAILNTIESETKCFFQRDYDCWQSHFVHADYAFQAWTNYDGSIAASVGWETIDSTSGKWIKENPVPPGGSSHPQVVRKNMLFHFFTNSLVFMTWDQYNSDKDETHFIHSKETRLLEKINGTWKIANVTALWNAKNQIPLDSIK